MRQESLVLSLVKPVVRALAEIGLTQKELFTGPIQHTDLVWQAPPLLAEACLAGMPLYTYFERRTTVKADQLYEFWKEALNSLRSAPYKVVYDGGYRNASYFLPRATPGERALYLSTPEGFGRDVDEYAGITLSLECARLLHTNTPVLETVSDDDNYYVVMADGRYVGVRDGLPVECSDEWDLPVNGMVQQLLAMPRGAAWEGCDYDLVAKLRSALHANRPRFKEFEGLDMALQTLRILAAGRHLTEVQTAIGRIKTEKSLLEQRIRVLRETLELSRLYSISDRARIKGICAMLVPDFMTMTTFMRRLYHDPHDAPAVMTQQALRKLQLGLEALLAEEESKNAKTR